LLDSINYCLSFDIAEKLLTLALNTIQSTKPINGFMTSGMLTYLTKTWIFN